MNKSRDPFAPTLLTNPVDYLLDHPSLVLVALALSGISLFAGYRILTDHERAIVQVEFDHQAQVDAAAVQHMHELQADWLMLPQPPLTVVGVMPVLPPLPLVVVGEHNNVDVSPRLAYLIDHNPDQEVASSMKAATKSGAIIFQFRNLQGPPAVLDGGTPPVMVFDPAQLHELATSRDALLFMLVLNHEWVHFGQHARATNPEYLATFTGSQGPLSPQQCGYLYQDEMEAYTKECRLALSWGVTDYLDGFCLYQLNPAAFAQQFFLHSLTDHGTQSRVSECTPTWAKLVGHPHPEAYE